MKKLYNIAKRAKVGDTCTCPSCCTKFIKTNYQQTFCRIKGGTICKDKYWNTITPCKRNNTTRISPASAARIVKQDDFDDDDDGSWDAHQCYVAPEDRAPNYTTVDDLPDEDI